MNSVKATNKLILSCWTESQLTLLAVGVFDAKSPNNRSFAVDEEVVIFGLMEPKESKFAKFWLIEGCDDAAIKDTHKNYNS